MNEYYEMGKQAALESLAELYDSNGGVDIGYGLEVISESLFDDQDKIASVQTEEDAIFLSGFEAELMGFAKEASDMMAEGWEGDIFLATLEKVAAKRKKKVTSNGAGKSGLFATSEPVKASTIVSKKNKGQKVTKSGNTPLGEVAHTGLFGSSAPDQSALKARLSAKRDARAAGEVSRPSLPGASAPVAGSKANVVKKDRPGATPGPEGGIGRGTAVLNAFKSHPGRTAAGVGVGLAGAYGAKKLYDRHQARKAEEEAQKTAAQILYENF